MVPKAVGSIPITRPMKRSPKRSFFMYAIRMNKFEKMLLETPGNSLGRTIEVGDIVLKNPERFNDLYKCYFSDNEWVRLRVSNAVKRVGLERLELLVPYIDKFLGEISEIDQPSTQWTLSKLYLMLTDEMTPKQKEKRPF